MQNPLVSVICLSFNHAPWIQKAVEAVLNQTYPNIELILIDDASTDKSGDVIKSLATEHPFIKTILLHQNIGNCKAFNKGLAIAKGKYIIDLAADDILLPERVSEGVKALEEAGTTFGVNYCNAGYIDPFDKFLSHHYPIDKLGKSTIPVPQGDLYKHLLESYFLCTPTMMMRKSVLDELGGYDEKLSYEDFDFWIRSARNHLYNYTDKVLVNKRIVPGSLSARLYRKNCPQLASTFQVCLKAKSLNKTGEENQALIARIKYEFKQAVISENHLTANLFYELLSELKGVTKFDLLLYFLNKTKLPFRIVKTLLRKNQPH